MLKRNFLLLLVAGAILCASFSYLYTNEEKNQFAEVKITVRAGDTVWSLAEHYTAAGEDVRAVVARIYQSNDLAGKVIKPGEELIIPVLEFEAQPLLAQANK